MGLDLWAKFVIVDMWGLLVSWMLHKEGFDVGGMFVVGCMGELWN